MNIYALKFREKGEKTYKSILIQAKDAVELKEKFDKFIEEEIYDVDKRMVSWAGGTIPFMQPNDRTGTVIYANLDELT